eukprot:SAG22_NODE_2377_length_2637_cov_1.511032_2_plen_132_part_00
MDVFVLVVPQHSAGAPRIFGGAGPEPEIKLPTGVRLPAAAAAAATALASRRCRPARRLAVKEWQQRAAVALPRERGGLLRPEHELQNRWEDVDVLREFGDDLAAARVRRGPRVGDDQRDVVRSEGRECTTS